MAQTQAQASVPQITGTPPATTATPNAPSIYDQIWKYTEWYRNDENPVIQRFSFTGRFQLDYATVGEDDFDDLTIRRFRLGGKATFFKDFTVHAEVDLQPEADPVYQRVVSHARQNLPQYSPARSGLWRTGGEKRRAAPADGPSAQSCRFDACR